MHSVLVHDFVSCLACRVNKPHHYSSILRLVVIHNKLDMCCVQDRRIFKHLRKCWKLNAYLGIRSPWLMMSLKMAKKLFKIADNHYCDAWSIHYYISLYTRIYNMYTVCSKQSFNKGKNKRSCSHPTSLILSNGKSKSHIQLIIWMLRTDCFTINTVSHSSTMLLNHSVYVYVL
jgi:hypothetical protein